MYWRWIFFYIVGIGKTPIELLFVAPFDIRFQSTGSKNSWERDWFVALEWISLTLTNIYCIFITSMDSNLSKWQKWILLIEWLRNNFEIFIHKQSIEIFSKIVCLYIYIFYISYLLSRLITSYSDSVFFSHKQMKLQW